MTSKHIIASLTLGVLVALPGCIYISADSVTATIDTRDPVGAAEIVADYVDLNNACDAAGMSRLVHEEIEWLSISGDNLTTVSKGKDALSAELASYMSKGCSTRSQLSDFSVNGPYVAVTETVSWDGRDGSEQSQSATSVYQIENGLIRRVWYFPEVR